MTFISRSALLLMISLLIGPSAKAQPPSSEKAFINAIGALKEQFGPQYEYRELTSPLGTLIQLHLATLGKTMAGFGTKAFPVNGYVTYEKICLPLNELNVQLLMSGAKSKIAETDSQEVKIRKLSELTTSNIVKHRAATMLLGTSLIKCQALHMPFFERFWADLPIEQKTEVRIGGIRQVRRGGINMLLGLAQIAAFADAKSKHGELAIKTLADFTPAFANVFTLEDRKFLLDQINTQIPIFSIRYPEAFVSVRA